MDTSAHTDEKQQCPPVCFPPEAPSQSMPRASSRRGAEGVCVVTLYVCVRMCVHVWRLRNASSINIAVMYNSTVKLVILHPVLSLGIYQRLHRYSAQFSFNDSGTSHLTCHFDVSLNQRFLRFSVMSLLSLSQVFYISNKGLKLLSKTNGKLSMMQCLSFSHAERGLLSMECNVFSPHNWRIITIIRTIKIIN